MQQMMFLFPLLLGLVMVLGATIAILRRLSKNQKPIGLKAIVVVVSLCIAFFMYKGIYKPFGLYENHFKQATGVQFPTSGDYVFADTWSDNAESDGYSSIALVSLPTVEIDQLKLKLKSLNYGVLPDSLKKADGLYDRISYALKLSKNKEIVDEYGVVEVRTEKRNGTMFKFDKIRYYFGFLSDDKTVVIYIISK